MPASISARRLPRCFFRPCAAGGWSAGCTGGATAGRVASSGCITVSEGGSGDIANRSPEASFVAADFEHRQEGLLRDLDLAELLHPLLALALLLQELALAGDVSAVALGGDVLAKGRDRFPRDDSRADGGLQRDLELVFGDFALEPFDQAAAPLVGVRAVHDCGQRIDRVALHQDVELDQIGGAETDELIVHGAVTAGRAFEL